MGNPDGVALDGSLHHAHVDDHPGDVPSSPDIPHLEFYPGDMPPSPDVKGGRFNFPGQTYPDLLIALTRRVSQPFCTMPIALTRRVLQPFLHSVAVFSSSFPICATDILRYFSLDILL